MTRRSKQSCAAAIAALSAAAIIMAAPAHAQISGFDNSSYTLNTNGMGDPASISSGNLNITTAVNDEANSAWYNTTQNVSAFTTSFTWTRTEAQQYIADGYAFAVQNTGANALGYNGGSLGYAGINQTSGALPNVNSSFAIGFEYFVSPYTDIWIEQASNGVISPNVDTGLAYANGPVGVQISYDGAAMQVNLTQGANTYSTSYNNVNLSDIIESHTAYVGFTGGTGSYNAGQQISDFTFTPVAPTASAPNPTPGLISISSAADVVESVDADGTPNSTGSNNSPDGAIANLADNNYATKYLNFTQNGSGFTDTPAVGSSVVRGLAITSANDSPERDPASYILYGSNNGTFSVSSPVISQGAVPTSTDRFATHYVTFANSAAYTSYELLFPTVEDPATANSMAVSDVRLLAAAPEPGAPAALTLGSLGLLGLLVRRRRSAA